MKILSTFVFTFFLIVTTYAQGFHFGIGGGANYTNVIGKNIPIDLFSYDFGYQINAVAEYKFCDRMSLRLEPGFESRRVETRMPGEDNYFKFNYINLPVMITLEPVDKLTFMVGPEIAYILSSPFILNADARKIVGGNNQDFDFGIKAGISYNITDHFELAFKYYRGLRPSHQLDVTDINGNSAGYRFHYQGFSLGAFYRI